MFKPGWTCLFSQIFFIFHCKDTIFKARSYRAQVTWYCLWTPGPLVFWVLELLISFLCMLTKVCVNPWVYTWRSEVNVRCLSRSLSTLFFWLSISHWIKHSLSDYIGKAFLEPWELHLLLPPPFWLKRPAPASLGFNSVPHVYSASILSTEPSFQPWIFHFLYGGSFQGLFCELFSILLLPIANLLCNTTPECLAPFNGCAACQSLFPL